MSFLILLYYMNIVFFSPPRFLQQQSMLRLADMFSIGMKERGHTTEVWAPQSRFFRLPAPKKIKKWFGYIDQYIVFPNQVRKRLRNCPGDTIFAFIDQALGPWVPLVANMPHVIHCNDFLAVRSALGEIQENRTSLTGRLYQRYIFDGLTKGENFISISKKTRDDLHKLLPASPFFSEVEYLGVNESFVPEEPSVARISLSTRIGIDVTQGYLLHVGGNEWYKNRRGVMEIYDAWRSRSHVKSSLLMIGPTPTRELVKAHQESPFKNEIHFLRGIEDKFLRLAYSGASVFLFPSLAEGFGWPIAEAMASGCPVITTNEAPMTEVAGNAAFFIQRRPQIESMIAPWASEAAKTVNLIFALSSTERNAVIEAGIMNAKRFDPKLSLERIQTLYENILKRSNGEKLKLGDV
jgi:glycosyltransferase involved in cell wall biosynthesis